MAELVDESHFHVMILVCPNCAQRFVSIFTEQIDWVRSDDPQYWQLMPITRMEADSLIEQRNSVNERTLDVLGPGRRCLHRDHPAGARDSIFWTKGISVGFHD